MSSGKVWLKPLSVTWIFDTVPTKPEMRMFDG